MRTSSERALAIEAHELRKDYRLGELPNIKVFAREFLRSVTRRRPAKEKPMFPALNGISFALESGECLGIMGPNGSGKSTLVQILAGITVPTGGAARVRGRVLPLLEVGAVFHEDLTGRENVTLFGTILGLNRREINEVMPDISAFGEIDEDHLDTPLKRYSTGMRARLSFAVAMCFPADLYIFDEIIAVVDDHFRALAVHEIRSLHDAGRTVIFISHDLDLVRTLCNKGLWIDNGVQHAFGEIDEVADRYVASQAEDYNTMPSGVSESV